MAQNNNNGNTQSQARGFAAMGQQERREIAAEGGRAAHASGRAHEWNSEEAREAGRKGGAASHRGSDSSGGRGGDRS